MSYILGVNYSHDRSACLLKDGKVIVAIEEERLDRIKHSIGFIFEGYLDRLVKVTPFKSITYCLDYANISIDDLDLIIVDSAMEDKLDIALEEIPIKDKSKIHSIPKPSHHLSHAYATYFSTTFKHAGILIVDAVGSYIDVNNTLIESESYFEGVDTKIKRLGMNYYDTNNNTISLGLFYNFYTSMLNFITKIGNPTFGNFQCGGYSEAGKLMGLAAYGTKREEWDEVIEYLSDSIKIDFSKTLRLYELWKFMENMNLNEVNYESKFYRDIAYKAQEELEKAMLYLSHIVFKKTKSDTLCIGGGIGLNALANKTIKNHSPFKNLYVQPSCNDSGNAIGCAFYGYYEVLNQNKRYNLKSITLGKEYSEDDIKRSIGLFSEQVSWKPVDYSYMAKLIAEGNIVGCFIGKSEFGHRALGHRSILADPRRADIRDVLNKKIKSREPFRPFAPSVLSEFASDYFEIEKNEEYPYMIIVAEVKKDKLDKIPSVVHEDLTSRIQTVNNCDNPKFYNLIYEFYKITGIPMLLNTSFNKQEPIVETPTDAIKTFIKTEMDYLLLENILIERR